MKNKVMSNADITIQPYIHRPCLNVTGVVSNFNEHVGGSECVKLYHNLNILSSSFIILYFCFIRW